MRDAQSTVAAFGWGLQLGLKLMRCGTQLRRDTIDFRNR